MELRHLRSFIVLAEELHFTHAAQKLNIVQPALTGQINALESEVGARLLDRDKRSVRLTGIGELFLVQAKATLQQAERALQIAQRAEQGELGTLRIGFVSTAIHVVFPKLVQMLRERYPRLQLGFQDMNTPRQLKALDEGRLDFGFLRMPATAKGIHIKPIHEEPFVLILPQEHHLAKCEVVQLQSLEDEPMIWLTRGAAPGYSDALLGYLSERGFIPHIVQEFEELSTLVGMTASKLGLAIVPASVAITRSSAVVARSLELPGLRSQIGLAWKDAQSAVGKNFLRMVAEISAEAKEGGKDSAKSAVPTPPGS
jgi:DNA-binding transcriptional LysR family regulator